MLFLARSLTRYWFIAPVLLIITGLQLGLGFVVANSAVLPASTALQPAIQGNVDAPAHDHRLYLSASTATPTSSPTPTITPSSTPSPTISPDLSSSDIQDAENQALKYTPTPTGTATAIILPTPAVTGGFTATVPILMYHYLSEPPAGADAIRRDLSVNPALFETHLAYLQQAGYETISFSQLALALSQQTELPARPIIISFDDGYRDNYENAFPLLRKYGFSATFFIFTDPIDTVNVSYLTWDMVAEMHAAGMEFGSHSRTHPDLSGRDLEFLNSEIHTSKAVIEAHLGEPVRVFSYPAGRYDNLTLRAVTTADFWSAVTTHWGATHSFERRFELTRVRVRGNDTAAHLAEKLKIFQ